MNKTISTPKAIITIIVLTVIAIGGVYAYQYYYPTPEKENQEPADETEPYIKVVSPNGGEQWKIGETYDITWESFGIDKVSITIGIEGQRDGTYIVAYNVIPASQKKYTWIVPDHIMQSGNYKIEIKAEDDSAKDSSDNYFSIIKEEAGTLISETADWKIYINEEHGFEIKYPNLFILSIDNCYNFLNGGEKVNDKKSIKLYREDEEMYVHICGYEVNWQNLSGTSSETNILREIDGREAMIDKFIIKGGGRSYYYIDQGENSSIFIDAFWAYPDGTSEEIALKLKEEVINQMISTFKFID